MKRFASILPLVVCLALMMPVAPAAPIDGTLNIVGNAQVAATTLTFLCDIAGAAPCPVDYGAFLVTGEAAQSGVFEPLAGSTGYIRNLNAISQPVNEGFLLNNFITFQLDPDIALDLTFIYAGVGGPCPPAGFEICTPTIPALVSAANPTGLSPFNLANTPTGSTASFSVSGETRQISTGETLPFNGTFSAQFTNTPGMTDASVASILSQFATAGTITTSYSATFVTAIPEPGTTSMLLGGLLILAGTAFRRRFSKQ
jgi:hypothetical protein